MSNPLDWFPGIKTYAAAAATILGGLASIATGLATGDTAMIVAGGLAVSTGFGLLFARRAVDR